MQNSSGLFERFDKIRKFRGLTYQEIENIAGIPKQTLFGLKRRDSINLKNLTALSKVLNVSVDQLLGLAPLLVEKQNVPLSDQNSAEGVLVKIPVWKLSSFGKTEEPKYRFMNEDVGEKTFGIAVDSVETNFLKGTILYFNPDLSAQSDSIVLLKKDQDNYCIRKVLVEGNDFYMTHLKLNLTDKKNDAVIVGVCTLIITDMYYSSFD